MSRYVIKNSLTTPPGGWRYEEIQSRAQITAGSLDELVGRVMDHYRANPALFGEVAPEVIRQKVIDWICKNVAHANCREASGIEAPKAAFTKKCCGQK